jgi:DNA-directed RNA polymerase sigma subunit (sigma70/sigma32)
MRSQREPCARPNPGASRDSPDCDSVGRFMKRCTSTLAQTLKPREAVILQKRLLTETPEPLREIGRQLALTGERVRQIEQDLINRLRAQFAVMDRPARPAAA